MVRFAATDGYAHPLGDFLDVLDVQRNQFGAAEGAGKAKQQQRAVVKACQRYLNEAEP